jgi:GNAT superfamily N-acetyltransferase
MEFRRARADERDLLNEMTLAGIRHWGHHESHPEAYAGLVASVEAEDSPDNFPVFVLEDDNEVAGFYELRDRGEHVELLRMFLQVDLIGKGFGRMLWDHAVNEAAETHDRMLIMSDPEAVGFYTAMGADLEKRQEVAPGVSIGVYWYELHKD